MGSGKGEERIGPRKTRVSRRAGKTETGTRLPPRVNIARLSQPTSRLQTARKNSPSTAILLAFPPSFPLSHPTFSFRLLPPNFVTLNTIHRTVVYSSVLCLCFLSYSLVSFHLGRQGRSRICCSFSLSKHRNRWAIRGISTTSCFFS